MKQINRFLTLLAVLCLLTVLVPAASAAGSYDIETFEPETGEITVRAGAEFCRCEKDLQMGCPGKHCRSGGSTGGSIPICAWKQRAGGGTCDI